MMLRVFFTVNVNVNVNCAWLWLWLWLWLIQLAAGTDFNAKFVESGLFVDKSELLKVFFTRNMATHELFTCPPGFGKTTNLKMIEKFSEIELDEKGGSPKVYNDTVAYRLFAGLKISRYSRIMNEHCAQHPVIFLDLHFSFKSRLISRSEILKAFSRVLRKSFAKYKIPLDQHFARNSLTREPVALSASKIINDDLNETEIGSALFLLSRELFRCFDKKVVLLIDGLDHVANEALTVAGTGAATATGDTRTTSTVDYYYKLLDDMLRSALAFDNAQCVYDLTLAVTSLAYRHDRFAKYMVHRRYTEYDPIIEYFGLLADELDHLFDKFACNRTEKQFVEKYYAGYRTVDQHDLRYNTRQITRYFKRRRSRSRSSTSTSTNLREKPRKTTTTTSVWRFLKNPEYLDKVSKLIKHCPFRKKFKTKYAYAYDHYDIYLDLIESDFKKSGFGDAQILYTYCIEYGIFSATDVTTYAIANHVTRNSLMANLRYYFAVELNINLKLVRFLLHRILHTRTTTTATATDSRPNANFREILQDTFDRIPKFDPREYLCTLEFVFHSVLHVAALTSQRLTVDEEYPAKTPEQSQETRCVTLVKSGHSAVIVKITLGQSAQEALQNALAYSYSDQRIRYLKYLAIDVDSNNTISLIISDDDDDENRKTKLLPTSTLES